MAYCPGCSSEIANTFRFCTRCGSKVEPVAAPPIRRGAGRTARLVVGFLVACLAVGAVGILAIVYFVGTSEVAQQVKRTVPTAVAQPNWNERLQNSGVAAKRCALVPNQREGEVWFSCDASAAGGPYAYDCRQRMIDQLIRLHEKGLLNAIQKVTITVWSDGLEDQYGNSSKADLFTASWAGAELRRVNWDARFVGVTLMELENAHMAVNPIGERLMGKVFEAPK